MRAKSACQPALRSRNNRNTSRIGGSACRVPQKVPTESRTAAAGTELGAAWSALPCLTAHVWRIPVQYPGDVVAGGRRFWPSSGQTLRMTPACRRRRPIVRDIRNSNEFAACACPLHRTFVRNAPMGLKYLGQEWKRQR